MATQKKLPKCRTCGAECVPSGITTGYGVDAKGRKHCFACCAVRDRANMVESGKATMYLSGNPGEYKFSNWPGSLSFTALGYHTGRHNIARTRRDAWFNGPDGFVWHGYSCGDYTEIAHCRRTRERVANTGKVQS